LLSYHLSYHRRLLLCLYLTLRQLPNTSLFPYTTLFRSFENEIVAGIDRDSSALPVAEVAARAAELSGRRLAFVSAVPADANASRSEEHTSELQSRFDLVCRLLLEQKKIS